MNNTCFNCNNDLGDSPKGVWCGKCDATGTDGEEPDWLLAIKFQKVREISEKYSKKRVD